MIVAAVWLGLVLAYALTDAAVDQVIANYPDPDEAPDGGR